MLVEGEITSSCGAANNGSLGALVSVQCILAPSSLHLNIVPNSFLIMSQHGGLKIQSNSRTSEVLLLLSGKVEFNLIFIL